MHIENAHISGTTCIIIDSFKKCNTFFAEIPAGSKFIRLCRTEYLASRQIIIDILLFLSVTLSGSTDGLTDKTADFSLLRRRQ